jgi:hypothetical protein
MVLARLVWHNMPLCILRTSLVNAMFGGAGRILSTPILKRDRAVRRARVEHSTFDTDMGEMPRPGGWPWRP